MTIRTDTIRKALTDLRKELYDARNRFEPGIDVPSQVALDDGSTLEIGLVPASDLGRLMGVYQAIRVMPNGDRRAKYDL